MKLQTVFCLTINASFENENESIVYSKDHSFDRTPTIEEIEEKVQEYIDRHAGNNIHDIKCIITQGYKVIQN